MTLGVILLAGGLGTRMQSQTLKQFMYLGNKPLMQHSLDMFSAIKEVKQIVVVTPKEKWSSFKDPNLSFAEPGKRRQDSCYNGLKQLDDSIDLVCIHDAARPFMTQDAIHKTVDAAKGYGAASVSLPLKFTIKEVDGNGLVVKTPDRSKFQEIQTPQVIKKNLLEKGFDYAHQNNLTVTDDVSLVELLGLPVKLIEGLEENIKVTTPHDFQIATQILEKKNAQV